MVKTQVLTKVPNKAPFPETITVKDVTGKIRYGLKLQTRSKEKGNDYVSWHRKKHGGDDIIMMKRGVWYLVYAW
jgi:hypothetical protein